VALSLFQAALKTGTTNDYGSGKFRCKREPEEDPLPSLHQRLPRPIPPPPPTRLPPHRLFEEQVFAPIWNGGRRPLRRVRHQPLCFPSPHPLFTWVPPNFLFSPIFIRLFEVLFFSCVLQIVGLNCLFLSLGPIVTPLLRLPTKIYPAADPPGICDDLSPFFFLFNSRIVQRSSSLSFFSFGSVSFSPFFFQAISTSVFYDEFLPTLRQRSDPPIFIEGRFPPLAPSTHVSLLLVGNSCGPLYGFGTRFATFPFSDQCVPTLFINSRHDDSAFLEGFDLFFLSQLNFLSLWVVVAGPRREFASLPYRVTLFCFFSYRLYAIYFLRLFFLNFAKFTHLFISCFIEGLVHFSPQTSPLF